jgi:hypothetical protein
VGNLLSLELGARMAIAKRDARLAALIQTQLPQVKEGDWVECNPLTNKDDLQNTLQNYNKRATDECKIDIMRIIRLRDALAHGRAFGFGSPQARPFLRLLKFSRKPDAHGKLQVTMAVDMTEDWFKENLNFLMSALQKVTIMMDYEMRDLSGQS